MIICLLVNVGRLTSETDVYVIASSLAISMKLRDCSCCSIRCQWKPASNTLDLFSLDGFYVLLHVEPFMINKDRVSAAIKEIITLENITRKTEPWFCRTVVLQIVKYTKKELWKIFNGKVFFRKTVKQRLSNLFNGWREKKH